MLIEKDGNCVKRKKRRKSTYRKKMKRKIRSFQMTLGFVITLAAALGVAGIFFATSKATQADLSERTFLTNSGALMTGASWKLMDGAQLTIDGYIYDAEKKADASGLGIYYRFYDQKLNDYESIKLNAQGIQYTSEPITFNRASAKDGKLYLYVQQLRTTENADGKKEEQSRIDEYEISFLEKAAAIAVMPETSDTQMTALKAGDTLRFIGDGKLYYTIDGTTPGFERSADGSVMINKETFKKAVPDSMKEFSTNGNMLEIPNSMISQQTLTIRVISCVDGKDFSPVATFRYTLTKDQAQKPLISPETTAENPVLVPDHTTATLTTQTAESTILYTLNGQVPSYQIQQSQTDGLYTLVTAEGTQVYTDKVDVTGKFGTQFTITAIVIKYTANDGEVMTASEPIQYVYQFADLDMAQAPESSPKSGATLALGDAVYLNTNTSGGKILYTLDGTSPTYHIDHETNKIVLTGSTKCYGEETNYILADKENCAAAGGSFLIQAKTILIDESTGEELMKDSPVVQFSFTINDLETVAVPTATPATKEDKPTVVEAGDKILLSSATAGAKIFYTTDGSAPVLNESGDPLNEATKMYDGSRAIVVPEGSGYLTITAFAVKEEMNDSPVVQFIYQYPQIVAPPYCTPAEGTVTINTEVALASLDKDALIYYTLDGTNPTATGGKLYTDPLKLTDSVTIKAICILDGISSSVRTFNFTVSPVLQPPTPSIASGSVITSGTIVKLSAASGAEILYTVDGSNPKSGSPLSGDTAVLNGKAGETISLITYAKGADYSDSQTATYVYTISNYENGIYVSPESGTKVKEGDIIQIDTDVTNAAIYYMIGGDAPDKNSPRGTLVTVPAAATDETFLLKAVAVPLGAEFPNAIGSYQYPYLIELASPKASIPNMAVLLKQQEVELTAQEGNIYYTTDGTVPDEYANLYAEKIKVDRPMTIQALCMNEEGAKSAVAMFTYSFANQVSAPIFSIGGGEVETGTTLTLRSDTADAVIYYTMDGQIPDPENPNNLYTYSGAIPITKPVHIKAIAVKDRMTTSEVTSATFTVKEVEPETIEETDEETKQSLDGSRLLSRRSFMDSGSGPSFTDYVLKSAMTGVVLSAKEGTVPVDAEIEVTQIAVDNALNNSVKESAGNGSGAVAGYEVYIRQNGQQITLADDVEVGFPIPEKYRNSVISIASVDEEGNVNLFNTRRDQDMAYVFTNHFGRYAIVGTVEMESEEEDFNYGILFGGCTILLLAAGYLLLRRAQKRKG